VDRCRVYYKEKGGGFPQVWAMVSLVCSCYPWLVLTTKVLQLRTNHLVWVLCRPVWVNEACQLFLVPSRSSNTPLYPSKCCELGSMPQLLPLLMSSTWTHVWVLQGVGSASPPPLSLKFMKSSPRNFMHQMLSKNTKSTTPISYIYNYSIFNNSCTINLNITKPPRRTCIYQGFPTLPKA